MYIPRHFYTQELVPAHVYKDRGEKAIELLDERLLKTLDDMRDAYGPIVINDWYRGGVIQWRGLRTEHSPVGTIYSQHRFGRAADLIFMDVDAESVRQEILKDIHLFPLISSIELGTFHLHLDVRNCERIKTYKP